ncbi:type II secretion system protein GspG [PVC group bacterium]|nr:type II secretion system protein GspG [PVC group bacterium]
MILLCTLIVSTTVWFDEPTVATEPSQQWTRRIDGENISSLELVSRRFEAKGRPAVWLVGVAHVADSSFYDDVALLLNGLDVVLYESVRPTGSRPPLGETPKERIESTRKSLSFVADTAAATAEEIDMLPLTMDEVIADSSILDRRLPGWLDDTSVDAWENKIVVNVDEHEGTLSFLSYGSDGKVGGVGEAADIVETRTVKIESFDEEVLEEYESEVSTRGDNIQQVLADSLGLEFQLDSLPYEEPNWFVSDLTIDEVETKLVENGADTALLDTISGKSFAAQLANSMLQIIPLLDALSGGGATSTARLLMIELLSMPDSDQLLKGIEPELAEVIIVDRNTELVSDLATVLDEAEEVSTIGILYGAGHMSDLSSRMEKLFGYLPVEDKWFPTMSVDPRESLLDESDLKRMRFILKYQMYKAQEEEAEETNDEK